jgi:hypothetical protein
MDDIARWHTRCPGNADQGGSKPRASRIHERRGSPVSTQGKRHGGLHAAAGKLGAGAGDRVRLALLGIVFKSTGLPEQYHQAQFVLWLKREGVLEAVEAELEQAGCTLGQELMDMYVSSDLAKPNLQRLMGRFPVAIMLGDWDVENVTRQIILAKKPTAQPAIEKVWRANLGEISRHLHGTKLEHVTADEHWITCDYPLLPVRRRFWERVLRMIDTTGTVSQLLGPIVYFINKLPADAAMDLGLKATEEY